MTPRTDFNDIDFRKYYEKRGLDSLPFLVEVIKPFGAWGLTCGEILLDLDYLWETSCFNFDRFKEVVATRVLLAVEEWRGNC